MLYPSDATEVKPDLLYSFNTVSYRPIILKGDLSLSKKGEAALTSTI